MGERECGGRRVLFLECVDSVPAAEYKRHGDKARDALRRERGGGQVATDEGEARHDRSKAGDDEDIYWRFAGIDGAMKVHPDDHEEKEALGIVEEAVPSFGGWRI